VQLRAARLAEVLQQGHGVEGAELGSTVASSSVATGVTHKTKLGRDIVDDYKTVKIGQSAYFTGAFLLCLCVLDVLSRKCLSSMQHDCVRHFPWLCCRVLVHNSWIVSTSG
jgi:hypothetical protein